MKHPFLLLFAFAIAATTVLAQEKADTTHKKSEPKFPLKEITAFHDALHPLVHDALPKKDFGRIRSALDKLLKRAIAIQKAKLPKDLAGRKKEIQNTSTILVTQLQEMVTMKDKVDDQTLEKTFNEMHDTFEQLAELVK